MESSENQIIKKTKIFRKKMFLILLITSVLSTVAFYAYGLIVDRREQKITNLVNAYIKEHDEASSSIENLITLSEEVHKYYTINNLPKKKKDAPNIDEWYLNRASLHCGDVANSLRALKSENQLVLEVLSVAEQFEAVFSKEAENAIEWSVLKSALEINNAINTSEIKRLRLIAMQIVNSKDRALKQFANISYELFEQNVNSLTNAEKKSFQELVSAKFATTIDKYLAECEKMDDASEVRMYAYEWVPIYMYRSLL